ncbi:MAG: hypothetical protein HY291_18915 [Planctomycetes bacterium]|nr:hypothetical protein [Planctomycetota bacterium]
MERPDDAWEDPWIASRREAEEQRKAILAGEPPDGSVSRRDCSFLGAKIFAFCLLSAFVIMEFGAELLLDRPGDGHSFYRLAVAAWVVTPPVALLGIFLGFDTYRLALYLRLAPKTQWYVWIFAFFCLPYITLPLVVQSYRRRRILTDNAGIGWIAPLLYALLFLFFCYVTLRIPSRDQKTFAYIFGGFITLFFADCLLVNRIAAVRNDDRLLPPPMHKFQYSLGAMLAAVLGLGTYVSGLVLIFRGK